MATENTNPFVLPGLGQHGDMAGNPLMASMEMMRHAWQNLAGSFGLGQAGMAAPMSPEDLDRRIADLRAVENWLRLNLAMLNSTIQGLEVQRTTVATVQSFMTNASGMAAKAGTPSSLAASFGFAPPDTSASSAAKESGGEARKPRDTAEATPSASQGPADGKPHEDAAAAASAMAQGWWNMLQKQFDNLAAATAATMHGAEALQAAAQQATESAMSGTSTGKQADETSPADRGRKGGAKKAGPVKSTAKSAASRGSRTRSDTGRKS